MSSQRRSIVRNRNTERAIPGVGLNTHRRNIVGPYFSGCQRDWFRFYSGFLRQIFFNCDQYISSTSNDAYSFSMLRRLKLGFNVLKCSSLFANFVKKKSPYPYGSRKVSIFGFPTISINIPAIPQHLYKMNTLIEFSYLIDYLLVHHYCWNKYIN